MNRISVQPLVEKTHSKPLDGELIVNTENYIISVANKDKIVSSIKDIKKDIQLLKILGNVIKDKNTENEDKIKTIEENILIIINNINNYIKLYNDLYTVIHSLNTSVINIENRSKDDYINIQNVLKEIYIFIDNFSFYVAEIKQIERKIDELNIIYNTYLVSNVNTLTSKIVTLQTEINTYETKLGNYVTKNTNTTEVNSIISNVKNLENDNTFKDYIADIQFYKEGD